MGGSEPGPGRVIVFLSVMPCEMCSWTGFQFISAVSPELLTALPF